MNENLSAPSGVWTVIKKIFALPLLWIAAAALLIVGQSVGSFTYLIFDLFPALEESDAWMTGASYVYFIGIWVVVLLVLAIIPKNRPILGALGNKVRGNTWRIFALGLAIGFGTNALCAAAALLNGDIHLRFDSFRPVSFVLILIAVFVQSSAEEVVCRGFLYQRLMRTYRSPAVAILGNALLFAALHLTNPGVSALAVVNLAVVGLLFSLAVYYFDSFWCAAAMHTTWNFTQNIVFGLPNSGNVMPYAVFKLDVGSAAQSFVYDPAFGIEGTAFACVVLALTCAGIILCGQKRSARPTDIWAAESGK